MDTIIIHQNVNTGEYYFSIDHCQPNINKDFVPITFYLPYHIKSRPGFESGIINNKQDMKRFLELNGDKEILNPIPEYQA